MKENGLKNSSHGGLRSLLRRRTQCPDENELAAYAEQQLESAQRSSVEGHLVQCELCRQQVAFLTESAGWVEPEAVPPALLAQARTLVPSANQSVALNWRWTAAAVAATLLLVAGIAIVFQFWQSSKSNQQPLVVQTYNAAATPVESTSPSESPVPLTTPTKNNLAPVPAKPKSSKSPSAVRNSGTAAAAPNVLSPREGGVVSARELMVSWSAVPNARFYEVSVVSAAGDSIYQAKSDGTELRLPRDTKLEQGAKYFVWVNAMLDEGRSAKSSVISFRAK